MKNMCLVSTSILKASIEVDDTGGKEKNVWL